MVLTKDNYYLQNDLIEVFMSKHNDDIPYIWNNYLPDYEGAKDYYKKKIAENVLYEVFKDVPKLPSGTSINFNNISSDKIVLHMISNIKTNVGENINLSIITPNNIAFVLNYRYYFCDPLRKSDKVVLYLAIEAINKSLEVEEIYIPRSAFQDKTGDVSLYVFHKEYEEELNKLVFYSLHEVLNTDTGYIRCFAVDTSETLK